MVLSVLMLLSLIACHKGTEENSSDAATTAAFAETTTEAARGDTLALVAEKMSDYVIVVDFRDAAA